MKENIFIMDHPLIQHKISMLRNETTGTNEFRQLVEEITVLMGYEALRDLPLEPANPRWFPEKNWPSFRFCAPASEWSTG